MTPKIPSIEHHIDTLGCETLLFFFLPLLFFLLSNTQTNQLSLLGTFTNKSTCNCLYVLYKSNMFIHHCPVGYSHAPQQKKTMKQEFCILQSHSLSPWAFLLLLYSFFIQHQMMMIQPTAQTRQLGRAAFVSALLKQAHGKHTRSRHTYTPTSKSTPDATCPTQLV